jgi:[citrate (pro-3S)-lyase] ligase
MSYVFHLISRVDIEAARRLVESESLIFESDYDDLVGVFERGLLIGCGARKGRVLKMLVVHPAHRGGDVVSAVVTALTNRDSLVRSYFIYSKPCAIASFERMHFKLLAQDRDSGIGLLENRHGMKHFLDKYTARVVPGNNGALVIDMGRLAVIGPLSIERLAAQVDELTLFVSGPAHEITAYAGVSSRIAEIGNCRLVPVGPYVLKDEDVPGYFLRPGQDKTELRLALDTLLFTGYLAPAFCLERRFILSDDPEKRRLHRTLASHGMTADEFKVPVIPGSEAYDVPIESMARLF